MTALTTSFIGRRRPKSRRLGRLLRLNRPPALALALVGLGLVAWGLGGGWSAESRLPGRPWPEEAVWVEVVGPRVGPRVVVFPGRPTAAQVLAAAGAGPLEASFGEPIHDGARVLLRSRPERNVRLGVMSPGTALALGRKMNLNRARVRDLVLLPGVGPVTARRIVADRSARGPFPCVAALERVRGVGPRTIDKVRPMVFAGEEEPR